MIEPEPLQQLDRTYVRFRKRKLSYFSGCDYFRLASHPNVIKGLLSGVRQYGLNVAASRLTTGNHALYEQLEDCLADFFDAEDALLTSAGYITNMVIAQALAGSFSHALLDEQSHASLIDAAKLLGCRVLKFKHQDPEHLRMTMRCCGPGARIILLTDGMFAHDGSAAPLADYLRLLPPDGLILVDDSHGAGVLGKTGKGTLEHAGVSRRRIIQSITLSKAFGTYGGAVLATKKLRHCIINKSNLFAGCTPLPLPLASAAIKAVATLRGDKSLRRRLDENTSYFKGALLNSGFLSYRSPGEHPPTTPGPIFSFIPCNATTVTRLRHSLLAADIYPPFLKYPAGFSQGTYRFVLCSEHTRFQLDRLLDVIQRHH